MKKYNKPTLNIEDIQLENIIAANALSSVTNAFGQFTHDENDINFEDFWN